MKIYYENTKNFEAKCFFESFVCSFIFQQREQLLQVVIGHDGWRKVIILDHCKFWYLRMRNILEVHMWFTNIVK